MYLKTFLLIVLIVGVAQAIASRKFPGLYARAGEELDQKPQVKEEFKCYYCSSASKESCVKKEKVCKHEAPICLIATGYWYISECSNMEYYEKSKKECEEDSEINCEVSYCKTSLCNA